MDLDLEPMYEKIMSAVLAEDVFGVTDVVLPIEDMLKHLKIEFEKIREIVDPENWSDIVDREMAGDAMTKLLGFYEVAQNSVESGTYGLDGFTTAEVAGKSSFETSKRKYYVGDVLVEGGTATIYEGFCEVGGGEFGKVIIKLVDDVSNNSFIRNEIRILRILHSKPAPQWKHLPFLLDTFKVEGRQGIVLRKFNGYDLLEVRENYRYKDGIDRKDMVWMLGRAMSTLCFAHSVGVIHANIKPGHLMIKPDDHNLCILDWSSAVYKPEITCEKYRIDTPIYSPPEVAKGLPPLLSADVFSLGKTMIWLLGGDPETDKMPEGVEDELQLFLRGFTLKSPLQRPMDVHKLYIQRESVITKLWGPKVFRDFPMDRIKGVSSGY